MGHAVTFDTHALIKKLEASGFAGKQAEALTEAIKEVQETHLEELATKHDLNMFRVEVNGQFALLKWMMGVLIAGVVTLVLKSFFM